MKVRGGRGMEDRRRQDEEEREEGEEEREQSKEAGRVKVRGRRVTTYIYH